MKKILPFILLLFSISLGVGQDLKERLRLEDIHSLVPPGYAVLDTVTGDLNSDAHLDLIVVYKQSNEEEISDVVDYPGKRLLVIYTGIGEGAFELAARNENVVLCYDCGGIMGDPYRAVVARDGYFTVEHYGGSAWRWTRLITFKYSIQEKRWLLHKDGGESYHASEPENSTSHVKTVQDFGIIPFEKYDVYKSGE